MDQTSFAKGFRAGLDRALEIALAEAHREGAPAAAILHASRIVDLLRAEQEQRATAPR